MRGFIGFLFALAAAGLLVIELGLAALGVVLAGEFVRAMWQRSPLQGVLALLLFGAVGVGLVSSWRREARPADHGDVHPGPSLSRIPITGSLGAVYMVQFVVWVLVAPQVGVFYAVLIGGGLLLLPVAYYMNRAPRHRTAGVALGGIAGVLCGLLLTSAALSRVVPLAGIFGVAVLAGVVGAGLLIVWRRREAHPSIAPYSK
jgi:hypothetical protein